MSKWLHTCINSVSDLALLPYLSCCLMSEILDCTKICAGLFILQFWGDTQDYIESRLHRDYLRTKPFSSWSCGSASIFERWSTRNSEEKIVRAFIINNLISLSRYLKAIDSLSLWPLVASLLFLQPGGEPKNEIDDYGGQLYLKSHDIGQGHIILNSISIQRPLVLSNHCPEAHGAHPT